jgi:hypothetical protein
MKKGQGISINVIIIAAIALLVLVILAVLVIRAGTQTGDKTQGCAVQGGKCLDNTPGDSCSGDTLIAKDCSECCPIFSTE